LILKFVISVRGVHCYCSLRSSRNWLRHCCTLWRWFPCKSAEGRPWDSCGHKLFYACPAKRCYIL